MSIQEGDEGKRSVQQVCQKASEAHHAPWLGDTEPRLGDHKPNLYLCACATSCPVARVRAPVRLSPALPQLSYLLLRCSSQWCPPVLGKIPLTSQHVVLYGLRISNLLVLCLACGCETVLSRPPQHTGILFSISVADLIS